MTSTQALFTSTHNAHAHTLRTSYMRMYIIYTQEGVYGGSKGIMGVKGVSMLRTHIDKYEIVKE